MPQNSSILHHNLLGKLLGYDHLSLLENSLIIVKNDAVQQPNELGVGLHFCRFKKGLLGGELTIGQGRSKVRVRFLKTNGLREFVNQINITIAEEVNAQLADATALFERHVFDEYPRDSVFEGLSTLCNSIHQSYNDYKGFWNTLVPEPLLKQAKMLLSYHPLDVSQLRKEHEKRQLEARKEFFNNVESNPLTEEQRLGVIRSNDRNMVLAAAGTGKTSVMVAKALDLIDRKLAKPDEILVLAYNRTAANELLERLEDKAARSGVELGKSPHISTFHALGRQLLREAKVPTHLSVFTEDELKLQRWVTKWIEQYVLEDTTRILDFIDMSTPPMNPFDFGTQEEYEAYIRDNEFRTLNNERVKGYQELLIANFLYINQIPYCYEPAYISKRRIEIGFDYKPDFQIEGTAIYIEHFGINRDGGTRTDIDAIAYNESMVKKRELHLEHGTTLIETFHYEWCENTLLSGLEAKLDALEVQCNPMNPEQIFEKLNEENHIANWSELMVKALQAMRVERLEKPQIEARLKSAGVNQPDKCAELLDSLQNAYKDELLSQNAIDFDDMIIRAIEVVEQGKYKPSWKYILVDEFQDISSARMTFIQTLISHGPSPSLTVVGDDWQSIYRFSGGKLELTTRFKELVGSFTETKLQKTFRYNNSIADTAGAFVMANPEQYEKHIVTHTQVSDQQVYLLDDKVGVKDGLYLRVNEVVEKIRANDENGTIAVIARYNYLLNEAKTALFDAKLNKNVNFWSYHSAKGLEADYCILIGFFQGKKGFPNENRELAVIEALLPSLDAFPHSEERRLLYVGITRAKKKSYIIADPTAPSEFITELLAPKYGVKIVSKAFQEQYRKIFKCPHCKKGYLRLVNGKFGEFYSCSSGLGCDVGKARVCQKCRAPSVDFRHASVCNNPACKTSMKICEKCGRPMKLRTGKYGEFWGCTGYGINSDQCKYTERFGSC